MDDQITPLDWLLIALRKDLVGRSGQANMDEYHHVWNGGGMGAIADQLDYSLLGRCDTFECAVQTYERGMQILPERLRAQRDLIRVVLDCTWAEAMEVRRFIHSNATRHTTMLYMQDGQIHLWIYELIPVPEAA